MTRLTHVYAAQGDGCVKVGVSRNVAGRSYGLRRHYGRRFEIVRTWEHPDPKSIEWMVVEVFERHHNIVLGREVFSTDIAELAHEIEQAIERYDRRAVKREQITNLNAARSVRVEDNLERGRRPFQRDWATKPGTWLT